MAPKKPPRARRKAEPEDPPPKPRTKRPSARKAKDTPSEPEPPKARPTARRGGATAKRAKPPTKSAAKRAAKKRQPAKKTNGAAKQPAPKSTIDEGAIVITGICGRLGNLLARRLHREHRVVGIDRRPFPNRPKDIVHHAIDLRRKGTRDVFRRGDIKAVVHLGVLHNPRASEHDKHKWNVVAFHKLLDYVAQYEVPKLVVLSSANVYGSQPDNPQFLTEEAPLLGAQRFGGMRDLIEMDMLAQSFFWKHPATETVILRPCHILGGVRNAPSNYLRVQRPITILGFDPMVQVVHERDVVSAVELALKPEVRGIFNVRGPGELPLSRLLDMAGRRPRPLPAFAAKAAIERMWQLHLTSFPPAELDFIRYVCMVDDSRAREVLGYEPLRNLQQSVSAVFSDR